VPEFLAALATFLQLILQGLRGNLILSFDPS